MRSAILFSLGLVLLGATSNLAGDMTSQDAPKEAPKPSKDSYVKIRVEVEIRGTLQVKDKGFTVTAQDRAYSLFHPNEQHSDWTRPAIYTLDFARAKDLRELAKVLRGKEVVVTAMAEVRRFVQKIDRPAGGQGFSGPAHFPFFHPTPAWFLQQDVLVTGLKSVGDE